MEGLAAAFGFNSRGSLGAALSDDCLSGDDFSRASGIPDHRIVCCLLRCLLQDAALRHVR
ncbi:hypothetical protein J2Z79_001971 [Symbiobacterium terraclitae]|uniref:Uncharacterized protein n=1 Tax=Symbiobacterium terraclitae TaxID=557451 RepID=A0ABS4JUK2_9FIRM|nr:hypothetical protein [Symbiobacterium terraclitae]MBP2018556.1 hypothetical protein [Symbiobacterium terraclitae]